MMWGNPGLSGLYLLLQLQSGGGRSSALRCFPSGTQRSKAKFGNPWCAGVTYTGMWMCSHCSFPLWKQQQDGLVCGGGAHSFAQAALWTSSGLKGSMWTFGGKWRGLQSWWTGEGGCMMGKEIRGIELHFYIYALLSNCHYRCSSLLLDLPSPKSAFQSFWQVFYCCSVFCQKLIGY